ncbi:MAG: undecaprenyl/decaprenyl-phosphate alpha-N-acetylglucosaminyl 1-phosphate transferase [Candidatus Stahlbacteria bacterium]|nr:undecaprenyl/decaprenyl-phosphate alpha-N-acetylglucosaminyl 1-phosphate transferase [Candidatus Stahlbacteria bacterium]
MSIFRLFFFCFILTVIFTPLAKKIGLKLKILDYPNERKIHSTPTPLLGGAAIAASFCIVILLSFHFSLELKGVVMGGLLLFLVGLVDDIKPLPAYLRLIVQIVACIILFRCGVMISFLPNTTIGKIGEFLITLVWIVWIINAVNFFDGIDGLATTLVAVSAFFLLIVGLQTRQYYFSYLAAALIGSCMGFLIYNFHPAKIFLGDAGANFLGFTLGSLAIMGEWSERGPAIALSVPILILGVFIFDMLYITISRIVKGETHNLKEILEYVGKDHLHHRLMNIGFTQRQAVLLICLLSAAVGFGAIVLRTTSSPQNVTFLILQALIIFATVSFLMHKKK